MIEFKINGDSGGKPNLTTSSKFSAKTGLSTPSNGSGLSKSNIMFYNGTQTNADPYLSSKTGHEIAYKNIAYLIINGFIGDNVRSAPNYSCVVKRTDIVSKFNKYANIKSDLNGDINPSYALYHIFTELIGLDEAVLDESSFITAGVALTKENLGVSFTMSSPQEAKQWIEEILRTIDGVMAINPNNGRLALRLLRDDYNVANLKLINESNHKELKFKRKSWDETYSRVSIKYTDRATFKEASVSAINSATRQTLGYERAYSVEYMAISNATNANKVLQRLMKKLSYPLATLKFSVSSDEFKALMVGDVLLFTNTNLGVKDMRIRILNLGSDKDAQEIEIEAMEDVFTLKNIIITSEQPSLYEPIDLSIGELKYFNAVEATAEMGEEQGVLAMAIKPSGFVQSLSVKDGLSGDSIELKEWTLAQLTQPLSVGAEIDDEAFFNIKEITPLWQIAGTRAGWQRLKFTCLIDSEFISFQFRDDLGDGVYRVKNLMRGLSGTTIATHSAGARVWFAPVDANDLLTLSLIAPSTTLYFNAGNFANQSEQKSLSFNHSGKSKKPYPISNLIAQRDGLKITLRWRNCVRLHGANYRNADNIPAGVDEGLMENDVIIKFNRDMVGVDGREARVRGESFDCEMVSAGSVAFELYASSYIEGVLSDKISIAI